MPRVPQVFASPDIGGSTAPVRAPLSFGDTSEAQQGLAQISHAARQFASAKDVLSDEQDKVAAELAMGEYEKAYADADIRMRQDPTITPDNYSERVDENLRAAREGVGKAIQSPRARLLFDRAAEKFTTTQSIKGKYAGLELSDAFVKAGTDTLLRQDATAAVFGKATPEEQAAGITDEAKQEAGLTRGLGRIQNLLSRRILSGTEADAKTAEFLANVQRGHAKKAAMDPEQTGAVIDALNSGGYPLIGTTGQQMDLAREIMNERDAYNKKLEEKTTAASEAERKAQVDALDSLADRGELRPDVLETARRDRVATGEDYRRLSKKVREFSAAGGTTDDQVYNRMELDILQNPKRSPEGVAAVKAQIRAQQEAGKFAASGPRSAATLMKMVEDESTAAQAKDITQDPQFKQGLQELHRSLMNGKSALESLTREENTRLENAEREYHDLARSGKFDNTDLPEVARRIVDRVRKQQPLMMGEPSPALMLRYQSPKELLDAKKAGIIPEAEFNRQFKLMGDLGLLNPRKDLNEIKSGAGGGGATPAAPKKK